MMTKTKTITTGRITIANNAVEQIQTHNPPKGGFSFNGTAPGQKTPLLVFLQKTPCKVSALWYIYTCEEESVVGKDITKKKKDGRKNRS